MTALGKALLAAICLLAWTTGAQGQSSASAADAFAQGYWTTTIELLKGREPSPETTRMLAISYYKIRDFDNALPLLEQAVANAPEDAELVSYLMDIRLSLRQYSEAGRLAGELERLGEIDRARFGRARIDLDREESRAQAKEELFSLFETAERDLAFSAADTLIEALLTDSELGPAYQVAWMALDRSPDPEQAIRYAPFVSENQANSRFRYDLGYRFEYDDNVTFPEEIFASGEEDYRHIFIADALYERPLGGHWTFYAQGNFLQSFHSDLKEFDQTRLVGSLGIGQMGRRTGWRAPLEVSHIRFDGDAFRTSVATVPGFYVQFGDDFLSHFYARLQQDDYDMAERPEEDRSGEVFGGGVLLTGQLMPRLQLRSYLEFNRYDADGVYWQRDEVTAFVHGEFEINARWLAALAFRYREEDYDNARPVFAEVQQDESKELIVNVTHKFAEKWWWRAQVTLIEHESNIPIFDYDRNIYSIAVTRDF